MRHCRLKQMDDNVQTQLAIFECLTHQTLGHHHHLLHSRHSVIPIRRESQIENRNCSNSLSALSPLMHSAHTVTSPRIQQQDSKLRCQNMKQQLPAWEIYAHPDSNFFMTWAEWSANLIETAPSDKPRTFGQDVLSLSLSQVHSFSFFEQTTSDTPRRFAPNAVCQKYSDHLLIISQSNNI